MQKKTWFERAIFLSWYCAKADCKFCYMSTMKNLDPKKARRTKESILAEALLCKSLGWKIEFLSGGYESYTEKELFFLIKEIHKIHGEKLWLNMGVLNEKALELFKPHLKGVTGAVECINPKLHDFLCPSKPLSEITDMFKTCDKLNLKKSMTLIIGLGESLDDFNSLKKFIKEYRIDRITFYALNPHEGTLFIKGPKSEYYSEWIRQTRKEFPKLEIVAGSWVNRLNEISLLLKSGADAITKFPAIKLFATKYAKQIENQVKLAGREFTGTLTKLPAINWNKKVDKLDLDKNLKEKIKIKLNIYLKQMLKNAN